MNDRYLYKAKRKHDSKFFKKCEWVDGAYYIEPYTDKCFIIQWYSTGLGFNEFIEVDEESVCQCTGLKDKNGKLIWENDIILCKVGTAKVIWNRSEWRIEWLENNLWRKDLYYWAVEDNQKIEVIGNIFDNPELIHE